MELQGTLTLPDGSRVEFHMTAGDALFWSDSDNDVNADAERVLDSLQAVLEA